MRIISKTFHKLDQAIPVYDVTIKDETPCFMLDAGIVSHNTKRWKSFVHCLSGETKIRLADGRDLPIEEIYKEFKAGKTNYVITVNDQGKFLIEDITKVQISGYVNKIAILTLDSGEKISCTINHRFLTRDLCFKEAKDLEDVSLFPCIIDEKIDVGNSFHSYVYDSIQGKEIPLHYLSDDYNVRYNLVRDISEDRLGKNNSWCRHHVDFDPLNNNPINVQRFGWVTHNDIHKNDPEARVAMWKTIKKKMDQDDLYKDRMMQRMKRNGKKSFEKIWKDESFRVGHAERNKNRTKIFLENNSKEELRKRICIGKAKSLLQIMDNNNNLPYQTQIQYDNSREHLHLEGLITKNSYPSSNTIIIRTNTNNWSNTISVLKGNHKVVNVKIVDLDTHIPVYDLSIKPDTPCFALSSGVISHNTIPWGSELREDFTARTPNSVIVHFDYSQSEVRIMAAMAGETSLLKVFEDPDADVHRYVASKIWKKDEKDVTSAERRFAKMATFSLLYMKGVNAFARDFMKGDIVAARKFFNDFFVAFPNIKAFINLQKQKVDTTGIVSTMFGDPLRCDTGFEKDKDAKYRHSVNYPIQSTSSVVCGHAAWKIYETCKQMNLGFIPLCFTHDSIDAEVDIRFLPLIMDIIKNFAESIPMELGIPAKIDMEIGTCLNGMFEMKKISPTGYVYEIEGAEQFLPDFLNTLKKAFKVSYSEEEKKMKLTSLSELFVARRAFSRYLGVEIPHIKGKLSLEPLT